MIEFDPEGLSADDVAQIEQEQERGYEIGDGTTGAGIGTGA